MREDVAVFDCKALEQAFANVHNIQDQLKKTGSFDGRTVLGFMEDFDLGVVLKIFLPRASIFYKEERFSPASSLKRPAIQSAKARTAGERKR